MPSSAQQPAGLAGGDDAGRDGDGSGSLIELVSIVAIAVGLALLIQAFVVKPYRIPSGSMEPTLQIGQRVLVNRIEGRFGTPARGDVVVFHPPAGAGDSECGVKNGQAYLPGHRFVDPDNADPMQRMPCPVGTPGKYEDTYIKRIIGLPGDRVKIIGGRAWVNGRQLDEPYISPTAGCLREPAADDDCTFGLEIVVPPDSYFAMGDNRDPLGSEDSRYWGTVPRASIIGKAFMTYWPPNRVGGL